MNPPEITNSEQERLPDKVRKKYLFLALFSLLITLLMVSGYFLKEDYFSDPANKNYEQHTLTEIQIPNGATLNRIADSLYSKKLIDDKKVFKFWVKTFGFEKKLRAGTFSVPAGLNSYQVVKWLVSAKASTITVTLLEGWGHKQIAQKLQNKLGIDATKFIRLCSDSNFIKQFDIKANTLEGYLLPDTYRFFKNSNEKQIIKKLVGHTLDIFKRISVQSRLQEIKMSRHELLTLAAIVEGEAILDNERKVIASLYLNRLKKGMRLQADPTIQYIIEGPPRRVLNRDLEIESPYNTYMYSGLPPGPINNPGRASIMATLFPDTTNYIYMVADGKGGHTFTTNLNAHLRAKRAFDVIRRNVAREKRRKGQN